MSGTRDDDQSAQVFNFPRIGFRLPGVRPAPPGADPATAPASSGATTVTLPAPDGPRTRLRTGRRSPLDALSALPDPGITQPLLPAIPAAQPGQVPDTFRNTSGSDLIGPRLGALSMAAVLATAVAALRGTHTVLSTWWEHSQARYAETEQLREARLKRRLDGEQQSGKHAAAMQSIGDKAAQQRAKQRVPSSSDFGRKTLGNRSAGSGGGAGSIGKGGRSGGSSGGSTGPGRPTKSPAGGKGTGGKGPSAFKSSRSGSGSNLAAGHKNSRKTPGTHTVKAPGGGKAPHSKTSSPALERARKRQDKAAGRKDGRLQRRAARQQARLKTRAKDHDAARDRKDTTKRARQDARDQVRAARIKARGDRRERVRDAAFKARRNRHEVRDDAKSKKREDVAAAKADRTTLLKALAKSARRRLKKRRKDLPPPVLSKAKRPKKSGGKAGPKTPKASKAAPAPGSPASGPKKTPTGGHSPGPGSAGTGRGGHARGAGAGAGAGGAGAGTGPGPGGKRKSPFAHAGGTVGTDYTVRSVHVPGSRAKRWNPTSIGSAPLALPATGPAAVDPVPVPHTKHPGTAQVKEPIPMPATPARLDPRIRAAQKKATRTGQALVGRRMHAQHETEVTLDEALDDYDAFAADGFKTHDQSYKLAGRAERLRDILEAFAEDLAVNHNLIGALFSGAMARMAESMDLVRRMSAEMRVSSLQAAEKAESANNGLNEAYRPYNRATADANLSTPSAPVHNDA